MAYSSSSSASSSNSSDSRFSGKSYNSRVSEAYGETKRRYLITYKHNGKEIEKRMKGNSPLTAAKKVMSALFRCERNYTRASMKEDNTTIYGPKEFSVYRLSRGKIKGQERIYSLSIKAKYTEYQVKAKNKDGGLTNKKIVRLFEVVKKNSKTKKN